MQIVQGVQGLHKVQEGRSAVSAEIYCTNDPLNERVHCCTIVLFLLHGDPAKHAGALLH